MSNILHKILEKIGKNGYDELNYLERETYDRIARALDRKPVTIEDVQSFIESEASNAIAEIEKFDNSPARDLYFKMILRNMRLLQAFITTPDKERERLITQLKQMFNL
jgi:hypothetical protein